MFRLFGPRAASAGEAFIFTNDNHVPEEHLARKRKRCNDESDNDSESETGEASSWSDEDD